MKQGDCDVRHNPTLLLVILASWWLQRLNLVGFRKVNSLFVILYLNEVVPRSRGLSLLLNFDGLKSKLSHLLCQKFLDLHHNQVREEASSFKEFIRLVFSFFSYLVLFGCFCVLLLLFDWGIWLIFFNRYSSLCSILEHWLGWYVLPIKSGIFGWSIIDTVGRCTWLLHAFHHVFSSDCLEDTGLACHSRGALGDFRMAR